MVDAHCHLFESANPEAEIAEFELEGGEAVICNGAGVETSKKAIELAERFKMVWATVGAHPEETEKGRLPDRDELIKLAKNRKVVAVGECGLDYFPDTSEAEREWQRRLLEFNFGMAEELGLPVVAHCRNAFADLYAAAKQSGVTGQVHCFTGDADWMKKFVELGWYISFGGIVTFKKSQALREVAKTTPRERLLVETDAPYLAPEPVRGQTNKIGNLKHIIKTLAAEWGESEEETRRQTSENAKRLFGIG